MKIEIRQEHEAETLQVENIVRDAFWNVYRPGCHEHLILHHYRADSNYLKDLSKVMTIDGRLIGQILFSRAELVHEKTGEVKPIATFGPVSILPEYQRYGYGSQLIHASLSEARHAGIELILIFGNPDYYRKFGFVCANEHGVYLKDQNRADILPFVMIKPLTEPPTVDRENGLWLYTEPTGYHVDLEEFEVFDRKFPFKEKLKLPGQLDS